jgi:hypothetical protein
MTDSDVGSVLLVDFASLLPELGPVFVALMGAQLDREKEKG